MRKYALLHLDVSLLILFQRGSRWEIYQRNSYAKGPPPVAAPWLTEGSKIREYADFTMRYRGELYAKGIVGRTFVNTHPLCLTKMLPMF